MPQILWARCLAPPCRGADGSGLINLNASQLTSGTVAEARLSTNVALRSSGNTFTGNQIVSSGSLGIGNSSPVAPLSFNSVLGDKISLYNSSSTQFYGFGIQSFQLQIHTDTTNADVVFGSGNSTAMTETMRIKGNGNVGIGTSDPGLNNLQINPLLESANGYGLVVCRTNYGANIQISSVNGQNAIGLVVDDVSNGDSNTSMLLIRNNMGGGGQTLMNVLATGKVAIGPITPTNTLHVGGGVSATAFVTTSDRNAKENFARVSPSEVLEKVAALPISTWNYKTMNDGRHMGPMAQDFYDAFHLGGGDTTITTIDPDGVALAAIQGLNQKLEQKQTEITELKKQVNELRDLVYSINHTQNGGRK